MSWAVVAGAAITTVGGAVANRSRKPSVSNESSLNPEQQQMLTHVLHRLGLNPNARAHFGAPRSTGVTPGQQRSLAALEEESKLGVQHDAEMRAQIIHMMQTAGQATDTEDVFRDSVENPTLKRFQEDVLPSVTKRFKGNAAFGSDRMAMESRATRDLGDSLTGARSKMVFDATEGAKNRGVMANIEGGKLLESMDSNTMQALLSIFGAHGVLQQQEQGGLDRDYARFVHEDEGNNIRIQQMLQAIGLGSTNQVVDPGNPGFLSSAAPGIGQALTQALLNRWLQPGTGQTAPAGGDPWAGVM